MNQEHILHQVHTINNVSYSQLGKMALNTHFLIHHPFSSPYKYTALITQAASAYPDDVTPTVTSQGTS